MCPVGEDQKQHLELARDIAQKFNNDLTVGIVAEGFADGVFFPLREPIITGAATRVMSLRDGTKKMSKSDPVGPLRINMTDDADTIAKKIQRAKTDPGPLPCDAAGLDGRPEARQPDRHLRGARGPSQEAVLRQFGGAAILGLQEVLADWPSPDRRRSRSEITRLTGDPAEIDRILADGSQRARASRHPSWTRSRISSALSAADAAECNPQIK